MRRADDFNCDAKGGEPSEELWTHCDIHMGEEMLIIHWHDHYFLPEAVNDDTDKFTVAFQNNSLVSAAEHAESLLRKHGEIKVLKILSASSRRVYLVHVLHLVNAVMLYAFGGILVGNQIVVFVVPSQAPGRDFVQIAVFLGDELFLHIPGTVLEADLFVFRNGGVYDINVCIDSLVICLCPIVNVDLALKPSSVFNACKTLQFSDQPVCLASRDEFGGLYCIHEQFQFRKAENPFLHIIAVRISFDLFDLEACMDKRIYIGINGSPIARTLVFILQNTYQILGIQDMLLVRARP